MWFKVNIFLIDYKYTLIQHLYLTCLLYEVYIKPCINSVGVESDYTTT